jgi:hypothetical protein
MAMGLGNGEQRRSVAVAVGTQRKDSALGRR